MNDPLPATARWGAVVALAALVVVRPATAPAVTRVAVLGLAAFSLIPFIGWLRTLWFVPVASAGLASWVVAVLLHTGQSVPVALAVASAVGAAAGAAAAVPLSLSSPRTRPWWSLLAAATVWTLLPQTGAAVSAPVLFGVQLSAQRPLAVTGVVLLAAAMWATTHVARTRAGREIAAAGAATDLAVRCGADLRQVWLRAGAVSGLFAAWAGVVLAVDAQNIAPAVQFSPAAAVLWMAAPLLGGPAWASGALVGAVAVGGLPALLPVSEAALAGLALVVAAVAGGEGVLAGLRRLSRAVP